MLKIVQDNAYQCVFKIHSFVKMAEGGVHKRYRVKDERSGKKCVIKFKDYQTFEQACKQKFGYSHDEAVVYDLEDDHATELDESAFECYDEIRMRPMLVECISKNDESEDNNAKAEDTDEDRIVLSIDNSSDAIEDGFDQNWFAWCSPEVAKLSFGAAYIKQELLKRGPKSIKDILQEVDKLPLQPLNICVTGSSGQGKSKLINTLRNLSPGDEGYAPVGTTETTANCTRYPHPHHPHIVFWDVPGVGTMDFPKEEYASKINLLTYDFFLICSATRFTTDDIWLANEVNKQNKRFYYIRTKVDQDIANEREELQSLGQFDEKDILAKLRKDCQKKIGHDIPVFLISCLQKNAYEFPALLNRILDDAFIEQQRSLIFGLVSVSDTMLEMKARYLKCEVWKTAVWSTVPGLGLTILTHIIMLTLREYATQFEITPDHIKRYAAMTLHSEDHFKKEVGLRFGIGDEADIRRTIDSGPLVAKILKWVPFLNGLPITMTYIKIGTFLNKSIDVAKQDAMSILAYVAKNKVSQNQ